MWRGSKSSFFFILALILIFLKGAFCDMKQHSTAANKEIPKVTFKFLDEMTPSIHNTVVSSHGRTDDLGHLAPPSIISM